MSKFNGIIIRKHRVQNDQTKKESIDSLYGWAYVELSAEEWMSALEKGQTINIGEFVPNKDGKYTHAEDCWRGTYFVCADGDEFEEIEPWAQQDGLSKRFPTLKDKAFAVQESVSSMTESKPHRRYRLIFRFDGMISSGSHYRNLLTQLKREFSIIADEERQPAQPVFGNARPEAGKVHIVGNILKLSDYREEIETQTNEFEVPSAKMEQPRTDTHPTESLIDFLTRHGISYTHHKKDPKKFYVECPYKHEHTRAEHGPTDAYVMDGDGIHNWGFYCAHASCKNRRDWESFKKGYNIQTALPLQVTSEHQRLLKWTDDDIDTVSAEDAQPVFPETELMTGIFAEIKKAYAGRIPIPVPYQFAGLKHIASAILGKSIWIASGNRIYPNIYTGLIGASADAHKTVLISQMKSILGKSDPHVQQLSQIATPEGLLNHFVEPSEVPDKEADDDTFTYKGGYAKAVSPELIPYIQSEQRERESIRWSGMFSEFGAILQKGNRPSGSGIFELLLQLYDNERKIESPTKVAPTVAYNPTFTLLGASALELIENALNFTYVSAGLTNRFEWYLSTPVEQMFLYGEPDATVINQIVQCLGNLREKWKSKPCFEFTPDARALGDEWFAEFTEKILPKFENTLVLHSLKRMKMHLIKNALIFAAIDESSDEPKIKVEHITRGIQLSWYLTETTNAIFSNFANSDQKRVEDRILEILRKSPRQSAASLANKMSWATFEQITRSLQLMEAFGRIAGETPKRTKVYFVVKDDL